MGLDQRPASWDGQERPKISAKLSPCGCGGKMSAHVDTVGMWHAECLGCHLDWSGDDYLGHDTWQELVREWNANRVIKAS